jgi:hypothetical protein
MSRGWGHEWDARRRRALMPPMPLHPVAERDVVEVELAIVVHRSA